jgi:hypothetical protein
MKSHPKSLRTTNLPILNYFTLGTSFLKQNFLIYSFTKSLLLKASKTKSLKAPSTRRRKKPVFGSIKIKAYNVGSKAIFVPILYRKK